jgi:hypothetical protein
VEKPATDSNVYQDKSKSDKNINQEQKTNGS